MCKTRTRPFPVAVSLRVAVHTCVFGVRRISVCVCVPFFCTECVFWLESVRQSTDVCVCQGEKKEKKGGDMRGKFITIFLTKR